MPASSARRARPGGSAGSRSDPLMTLRAVFDIGGTGAKADAAAIWIVQFVGREFRVARLLRGAGPAARRPRRLAARPWLCAARSACCRMTARPTTGSTTPATKARCAQAGFAGHDRPQPGQGRGACSGSRRRGGCSRTCGSTRRRCAAGLEALGAYHERRDEVRGIGLGPAHDWSSHAADAFGLGAVAYEAPLKKRRAVERPIIEGGWMG